MAVTANGFVARSDGSEDFLPSDGWHHLLKFTKEYGHLIWGRKTYELVKSWGGEYIRDLSKIPIIVVSRAEQISYPKNVIVASSPTQAMEIVKDLGYSRAFLSGGPTLNTAFAKAGLIDEIILNYNPIILGKGIQLFTDADFELNLKLVETKVLSGDILRVRYGTSQLNPSVKHALT